MKIEMTVPKREVQGTLGVEFEVSDSGKNLGTLVVGKAGVRWRASKAGKTYKGKSWTEVRDWLNQHGRTLRVRS